jgi:hypothetical protein
VFFDDCFGFTAASLLHTCFSAERTAASSTETPQQQVNIAKVLLSRIPVVPRSLLAANSPLSQLAGALNQRKPSRQSVFFSVAD